MYDLVCGGVVIDPGESLYQPGPGCQLSPYILDLKISLEKSLLYILFIVFRGICFM